MSHDPFNLSISAPVEIREYSCHDVKKDGNSPTGILVKITVSGGQEYWIPFHYHCDEDEIDGDAWLAVNPVQDVSGSAAINVAWDTKEDKPLYAYSRCIGGEAGGGTFKNYLVECHAMRTVSFSFWFRFDSGQNGYALDVKISIDNNPARNFDFQNKMWNVSEIDLGPAVGGDWTEFYFPTCIRMDMSNPDILAIGCWSMSSGQSKIVHFRLITDPPTNSIDEIGLYKIVDIEWLGTLQIDGHIVDFYHDGDTHKYLRTYNIEGISRYYYGNALLGSNDWSVYTFAGARVLSLDNCIYVSGHYPLGENYGVWNSLKGSPIDGWQATGFFPNGYYAYPIGVNSLLRSSGYSFCLIDRWYTDPDYERYSEDLPRGWWTSNGIIRSFPINHPDSKGLIIPTANGDLGCYGPFSWEIKSVRALDTDPVTFKEVRPDGRLNMPIGMNPLGMDNYNEYSHGSQLFDSYIFPYSYFKGK